MAFSDADLIDEDGQPLGRRLWDTRLVGRTLRRRAVVPEQLFARRALTTGCTMALRRRAVAAALPFPPELFDDLAPMRHDRWLSLVAAAVGTVRALPEPLLAFRVHPNQETGVLVGGQLSRALAQGGRRSRRWAGRRRRSRPPRPGRAAGRRGRAGRGPGRLRGGTTPCGTSPTHHRSRVHGDRSVGRAPPEIVGRRLHGGGYGWDGLGVGAVAGDVVRAVRQPGWTEVAVTSRTLSPEAAES